MQIKKKDGTLILCSLLIVLSGLLYYHTYSFPKELGPASSEYGSAFFPRLLLIFITVSSLILLFQNTFQKARSATEETISLNKHQLARVIVIWLLGMAFFWAWKYCGYLYTSGLFMLTAGLVLTARNIVTLFFLAALGPLMYIIFEKFLNVGL